mgnify:CR=1 FL=1
MAELFHCTAYYPELWPEEEIEKDISIMKECGINLVPKTDSVGFER